MVSPARLSYTAKLVCVDTLLFGNNAYEQQRTENSIEQPTIEGTSRNITSSLPSGEYMLKLLETECFTAVSEEILKRVVEYYPFKLTNRLLLALLPPYTREITLINCKEKLTLMGLVEGLKKCARLQRLNLQNCSQLLHADLFTLVGLMNNNLTSLLLEDNSNVTDEIVQAAIRALPNLTTLNISCCHSITDDVFLLDTILQLRRETSEKPVAGDYPYRLSSVDMSGNSGITSVSVRHLTSLCGPNLRQLNLAWSTVDSTVLFYLAGYNFPAMTDLVLSKEGELRGERELREYIAELKQIKELYSLKDKKDQVGSVADTEMDSIRVKQKETVMHSKTEAASTDESRTDPVKPKPESKTDAGDVNPTNEIPSTLNACLDNAMVTMQENSDNSAISNNVSVNPETYKSVNVKKHLKNHPEDAATDTNDDTKDGLVKPEDVGVLVDYDVDSFMYQSEIINLDIEDDNIVSQNDMSQRENLTSQNITDCYEHTPLSEYVQSLGESALDAAERISGIVNEKCIPSGEEADDSSVTSDPDVGCKHGVESDKSEHFVKMVDTEKDVDDTSASTCIVCSHLSRQIARSRYVPKEYSANGGSLEQTDVTSLYDRNKELNTKPSRCSRRNLDDNSAVLEGLNVKDEEDVEHFWDIANYGDDANVDDDSSVSEIKSISAERQLGDNIKFCDAINASKNHTKDTAEHSSLLQVLRNDNTSSNEDKHGDGPSSSGLDSNEQMLEINKDRNESAQINACDKKAGDMVFAIAEIVKLDIPTHKDSEKSVDSTSNDYNHDTGLRDRTKSKIEEHNKTIHEVYHKASETISELEEIHGSTLLGTQDNEITAKQAATEAQGIDNEGELDQSINNCEDQRRIVGDNHLTVPSDENRVDDIDQPNARDDDLLDTLTTSSDMPNDSVKNEQESASIDNDVSHDELPGLMESDICFESSAEVTQIQQPTLAGASIGVEKSVDISADAKKSCDVVVDKDRSSNVKGINQMGFKPDSSDKSYDTSADTEKTCHMSVDPEKSCDTSVDPEKSCDSKTTNQRLFKPGLLSLNITNIKFISMKLGHLCLRTFLMENPGLQRLELSWKGLTEEFLKDVIANLKDLREVSLEECTFIQNGGLSTMLKECQQLRDINLRGVVFIKDMAMSPMYTMSNLTKLNLAESEITDGTLFRIASRLNEKLTDIDLSWCESITEKGINYVCLKCTQLQNLVLRSCPVSNITLQVLSRNCPRLTALIIDSVEMSSSHDFSDTGLLDVAENLQELQTLDISWNLSITNVSISALMGGLPKLKEVRMKGLKQITCLPFLPIISGVLDEDGKVKEFCVDEYCGNLQRAGSLKRSTAFASELSILDLEYSDLVEDKRLELIVKVCRGSLAVFDYYGRQLVPDDSNTLVISSASVQI